MKRIQRNSSLTPTRTQRGLALVISLVLLVAMTVIALATMSGTRLNERITSNAQQKAISFEAAESAISAVWSIASANAALVLMTDSFDNPQKVSLPGIDNSLSSMFDQIKPSPAPGNTDLSVDITASVTIQLCGEATPLGTSVDADESKNSFVNVVYDFNGVSSVAGSNARSDHLQRGTVKGYKPGAVAIAQRPTDVTPGCRYHQGYNTDEITSRIYINRSTCGSCDIGYHRSDRYPVIQQLCDAGAKI